MRWISASRERPSERRKDAAGAATYSPHTLRRGKALFSSTATERPARASSSAAVAPAGPPPMISASSIAPRHEQVAEGPGRPLEELPPRRPGCGELAVAEPRAYADHRVVARDIVGADQADQAARR